MMRFTICDGCKVTMTLPDDYLTLAPWMAAHSKVCPGEGKLHVVAKVKMPKKQKGKMKLVPGAVSADVDAAKFVAAVGKQAAHDLLDGALNMFFKGKVE